MRQGRPQVPIQHQSRPRTLEPISPRLPDALLFASPSPASDLVSKSFASAGFVDLFLRYDVMSKKAVEIVEEPEVEDGT